MSIEYDNTREKILNAVWLMLEVGPPQAVRMADIANKAGISRQAVYLHFKNRNELIQETRNHIDKHYQLEARIQTVMQQRGGQETLIAYIDLWVDYLPKIRGVASALLAAKAEDEAAGAAWDDCMKAHRRMCHEIMERLAKDGEVSDVWEKEAAMDMIWSILSFEVWQLLTIDRNWTAGQYRTHMVRALNTIFR